MTSTQENQQSVKNGLCSCTKNITCASCMFWEKYNTPSGRKSLCEKIVHFLVLKPFYQYALTQTVDKVFPNKVIYEDQKDICSMLFESVLFEDMSIGKTPFAYFLENASLSPQEKQLYESWQAHTIYGFFIVENVILEKEIHLTDLNGKKHYRIYETKGTLWAEKRKVVMCRIVPFLQGWMIMTETVVSYSNVPDTFKEKAAGIQISQFIAVKKYHEDRESRRVN